MHRKHRIGFTLIELLVVITIIVVLLTLLVPAMDRAIYQAELAVCSSQIKAITNGAMMYAAENKRYYFDRPLMRNGNQQAVTIRTGGIDDRPKFEGYIPLDALLDPMVEEIPIDPETTDADGATPTIHLPYQLWFGFQYSGRMGMLRMGQPLVAEDGFTGQDHDFRVMVSDIYNFGGNNAISSHSGKKNILTPQFLKGPDFYQSWWASNAANSFEDIVDNNIGFTDLSVQRLTDQTWSDPDDRLGLLPYTASGSRGFQVYLPR